MMKPMPGSLCSRGRRARWRWTTAPVPISVTGMQFVADGYVIEGDAIELAGAGGESVIRVGIGDPAGSRIIPPRSHPA